MSGRPPKELWGDKIGLDEAAQQKLSQFRDMTQGMFESHRDADPNWDFIRRLLNQHAEHKLLAQANTGTGNGRWSLYHDREADTVLRSAREVIASVGVNGIEKPALAIL